MDVDDIERLPSQTHRYIDNSEPYHFEETTLASLEEKRSRWYSIALIVVLVIIALLTVVALIIAIYSLVLITKATETSTTTLTISSTIATTAAAVCTSSPTTIYQSSTATPLQCLNYINNTDATRNIGYSASINLCDNVLPFNNITSVWIRFQGAAGSVIANAPVSPGSCGTVATGWYAGQYPSTVFTTATSLSCFYYATNTCYACNWISVTHCQTYYVFLLPAPQSCNYRYCTL